MYNILAILDLEFLKLIGLALKNAASYVVRRMCQPVWFHIHLPEVRPVTPAGWSRIAATNSLVKSIQNY